MPQANLVATWGEHLTDAELFAIALAVLGVAILWLATAAYRHRRNLRAIGVRVHVSGTRGKTTTTRMIAAGLRAGGLRTVAKSTGSEPRFVMPDGVERAWPRRGVPSIREQAAVVRKARGLGAQALVVECMAIRPEFVWASETYLIEATTAVITNARADHFEDLGLDPHAVEEALRWAVPRNGALVVTEEAATPTLLDWARRRNSSVTVVATRGLDPMAADKALALAVCRRHGVADAIAGPAIDLAVQDPGHFSVHALRVGERRVTFANAFACNDAESLALLWPQATGAGTPVVVLNARQDRPLRTKSFLQFFARQTPMPHLYIVGDPLAVRYAREAGLSPSGVRLLQHRDPEAALREVAAASGEGGVIWGVGNYKGFGSRLIADLAGAN
jgi:poly-gamma-glutamate synthase PgsB/CapB